MGRYEIECRQLKNLVENLQQELNGVKEEKKDFVEKLKILSNDLKINFFENQGLLESLKKLEAENNDFEKLAEDNETTKLVLKNQIAEQEENFQILLKENEVIKNKL